MPALNYDDKQMFEWWLNCYGVKGFCGLCGQSGIIHTEVVSPGGVPCGGYFFCPCPNGQKMHELLGEDRPNESIIAQYKKHRESQK